MRGALRGAMLCCFFVVGPDTSECLPPPQGHPGILPTAPCAQPNLHACRLELVIDGDTAAADDAQVEVEIWSSRLLWRDAFKGRVLVPLAEVQQRGRLRGSWPMQDVVSGVLQMELSWRAAASAGIC